MSGLLGVASFLGDVLGITGAMLEELGPSASTTMAQDLQDAGLFTSSVATTIEENPWVGVVGVVLGAAAVIYFAGPIELVSAGVAAEATTFAQSAVLSLFAQTEFSLFGAYVAAEVSSLTATMTAVVQQSINYFIGLKATEAVAAITQSSPTLGSLLQAVQQSLVPPNGGNPVTFSPNLPSNLPVWNTPSGSTSYQIYNPNLTVTPIIVTLTQSTGIAPVQAVVTDGSNNTSLTLNYGNSSGGSTSVVIGGGDIDPILSSPPIITQASDGSIVVDLPDSADANAVIIDYENTGTVSLMVGADGATTGQNIISLSEADFNADTLDVTNLSASTYQLVTDIGASGIFELTADYSVSGISQYFDFAGSSGILKLDAPESFAGTIYNFQRGDTIDLARVTVTGATLSAGNVLTLQQSGGSAISMNLDPTQSFASDDLLFAPDGTGGTDVGVVSGGYSFTAGDQTLLVLAPQTAGVPINGSFAGGYFVYNFQPSDTIDLAGIAPANVTQDGNGYIGVDIAGPDNSSSFIGITGGTSPITASISSDGNGGSDIVAASDQTITYTFMGNEFTAEPQSADITGFLPGSISATLTFNVPTGYTSTGTQAGFWQYSYYQEVGNILEPVLVDWTINIGGIIYDSKNLNVFNSEYDFQAAFVSGNLSGTFQFRVTSSTNFVQYTAVIAPSYDELEFPNQTPGAGGYAAGESTSPSSWTISSISSISCYAEGTLIVTPSGEVAIDRLGDGDLVLTHDGRAVPVQWVGHRRIDCRDHPQPEKVRPVRVSADAFGDNLPQRDLWLSPDHAVFVDDALIPIKCLLNGSTVTQLPVNEVTYYHIELPQHDVLLAEGLPAESYLDTGDRDRFANGGGALRLFPEFDPQSQNAAVLWEAYGYAPLVVAGPQVETVRDRLLHRSAQMTTRQAVEAVVERRDTRAA